MTTNTNQTITGVKTFKTTQNHYVTKVVITDRDNTVTPTETKWTDVIQVFDKNNKVCGVLAFNQWPDGSNTAELHAEAPITSGTTTSSYIGVRGFKDGTFKTMCPTPASDSNTNEIATTAWVRSVAPTVSSNVSVIFNSEWLSFSTDSLGNPYEINIAKLNITKTNVHNYLFIGNYMNEKYLYTSTGYIPIGDFYLEINSSGLVEKIRIPVSSNTSYKNIRCYILKLW